MNRPDENRQTALGKNYLALGALMTAVTTILLLPIGPASAVTRSWNTGDGNWNMAVNWTPVGVPGAGDTVSIGSFGDGVARTITYNYPGAVTLNSLGIDLTGGNFMTTTLSMPANNLTAIAEYVGYNGNGTLTQSGGTNTISAGAAPNYLDIGVFLGATGTYNLSGTGALVVNTNEYVGDVGTGFFNQMGGTNSIIGGGSLFLGENAVGIAGTYTLSAGTLSTFSGSNGSEFVGHRVSGTFIHSGGTNTGITLQIGSLSGSTGMYTLSGTGAVSFFVEYVGASGNGTFNQMGGTNSISKALIIAGSSGSTGAYNLSAGSVNVGSGGVSLVVGGIDQSIPGGSGVFTVSGTGVLTAASIQVVTTPGSAVNLSGGTINTAGLNVNGDPARFHWTSGTLNITTNVTWDSTAAGTTTAGAFGASLTLGLNQTLMVSANETIGGAGVFSLVVDTGSTHYVTGTLTLSPTGTITQNAGSTLYAATFTQAGGTVAGTLQNQGNFIYQSGSFNGRLLNQGTVSLGPSFIASNGIENDASMTLNLGQTLTVNGLGLDNLGTFTLSGGTISGAGPALNDFGGTLVAFGTINPLFTNNGLLKVAGVLRLTGGAANAGFLEGGGTVIGAVANNAGGIIDANNPGAPLSMTSLQGNGAGASVQVAAGCLLSITNTWTNSGMVVLQGNDAMLNGAAITNIGTIQGLGNVNAAVANTGTIEALGGTLVMGGMLQNSAGGLIRASSGNKLLVSAGLAANAGIINLTGGTFDNNNHPLDNTGQISGYGTFATGGTGLDNHGRITFTGGVTTVNGPVTNEDGKTITIAYNPAIFTGLVTNTGTGTFNVISTTVTFAGGSSGNVPPGAFTNSPAAAFAKAGSGALEVDGPPTLGTSSSLAVNDTGTLRFKAVSGSATVGTGVTATVAAAATLELAGSVSALSAGANRVNIVNSSAAPGLLISGTHQQVGNIDGPGTTQVNAGSDLTTNHIIQNALLIGGATGSPATMTIDASDSSGNPLVESPGQSSGLSLGESLTSSGPFGAGVSSASPITSTGSSPSGSGSFPSIASLGSSSAVGSPLAVPEPSTLMLSGLAGLVLALAALRRRAARK